MGLKDIDAAVRAYQKLSIGEKAVFKSEVRQKKRKKRKPRKKQVARAEGPAPVAREATPRKKGKGKRKKGRRAPQAAAAADAGFTDGLSGPRADPLQDISKE
ncbi:hypothetical protein LCGC14_1508580 [marine sediment metagenome]|uniref:Uncharacterized protein n=1 Tax=marine sediment metagenome TaxID=412755 RepID=A0A0F9LHF1_9ZZZZ